MMAITFSNFAVVTGLSGVVLYLLAYALLQMKFIGGTGYMYPFLNAAAATCVAVSLIKDFNIASALTQATFISISVAAMGRIFYVRNRIKFDEKEAEFKSQKFSELPNDIARMFFDKGEWLEVPAGAKLSVAGEPVDHLYYIHEGECTVKLSRKTIGSCGSGDFVGEITCFTDDSATGTVITKGDVKLFRIDIESLKELCAKKPILKAEIENGIADNLRSKFIRTNNENVSAPKKLRQAYSEGLRKFSKDLNQLNV